MARRKAPIQPPKPIPSLHSKMQEVLNELHDQQMELETKLEGVNNAIEALEDALAQIN